MAIREKATVKKSNNLSSGALGSIISKLKTEYPSTFPQATEAGTVKRIITSSPKINYIFNGGFPLGRIIELFGPSSGGKTVLASYIGGQVQQRKDGGPPTVLFIDFEKTFDWRYADTAGMKCEEPDLIYMSPLNGEEAFTYTQELVSTGQLGLIIWDSVAATPTNASMEDDYSKANFGSTAKLFSEGLRKLNAYLSRYNTSLLLLNQVRDKIGFSSGYGPQEQCVAPETMVDISFP